MRAILIGAVEMTRVALDLMNSINRPPIAIFSLDPVLGRFRHGDYTELPNAVRINVAEDHVAMMAALHPDAILVFGWSGIIRQPLLSVAPCYGWHPTELPIGRGRNAITWTIMNGLTRTGFTVFRLADRVDAGNIMGQTVFEVSNYETVRTLYDKHTRVMQTMLPDVLDSIEAGHSGQPQDHRLAIYWRKRVHVDGVLTGNWFHDERLVRGLSEPYCGAETPDGVKVWTVEKLKEIYEQGFGDRPPSGR